MSDDAAGSDSDGVLEHGRAALVDLLKQAAKLEHSLLLSYLSAACSLKILPDEFSEADDEPNRRRAIQFERCRHWKQTILNVAVEEMRHLHFVQCMLRSLGEAPCFELPDRNAEGEFVISNWIVQLGTKPSSEPTRIPLGPLTPERIRQMILFESSDSMQNEDPFGAAGLDLFRQLHDFETSLRLESIASGLESAEQQAQLKAQLKELYERLTPRPQIEAQELMAAMAVRTSLPLQTVRFQSIADLYNHEIKPRMKQAFSHGWVINSNRDLLGEEHDTGGEALIPIGPIFRSSNFEQLGAQVNVNPFRNYKDVDKVIEEIVEEGEGTEEFRGRAESLLQKVQEIGVGSYLTALQLDMAIAAKRRRDSSAEPDYKTPLWLASGQLLRQSHLYRFVMIAVELDKELVLARSSAVEFEAARKPIPVTASQEARYFADDLSRWLNATYLVTFVWLSRLYEMGDWNVQKARRLAIENLATWPLMSLALRRMLEIISFIEIPTSQLFDPTLLPTDSTAALALLDLYRSGRRSVEINRRIDQAALRVLTDLAGWARRARAHVSEVFSSNDAALIVTRLDALSRMDEFERQFPFRMHGGYSGTVPDAAYQAEFPGSDRFGEHPASWKPLEKGLVLRLRFSGFGLIQFATDPDPPTDEVGAAGTLMVHSADQNRHFDRSISWQDFRGDGNIIRQPRGDWQAIAVDCRDVTLMIAGSDVAAGFTAALNPNNSAGSKEFTLNGLVDVSTWSADDFFGKGRSLGVQLMPKAGVRPYLFGDNHLVWQDGEPIDPFVLAVLLKGDRQTPKVVFQREVYNEGLPMTAMSPLERILTSRSPYAFGNYADIPNWVLTEAARQAIGGEGFPVSYLKTRAKLLADSMRELMLSQDSSQNWTDLVISAAERALLVAWPRSTTVGWLTILLHYAHTISGNRTDDTGAEAFSDCLFRKAGMRVVEPNNAVNRDSESGRWLFRYTKGVMDTDALTDLVYGELYIPVIAAEVSDTVTLRRSWSFNSSLRDLLVSFACRFDTPFWASYRLSGTTRTLPLGQSSTLTETLITQGVASYSYRAAGVPGSTDFIGEFSIAEGGEACTLAWTQAFTPASADAASQTLGFISSAIQAIDLALRTKLSAVGDS